MNRAKILCFVLVFFLLVIPVYSLDSGVDYNVTTIGQCIDDIVVKLRGKQQIKPNEYSFIDCKEVESDLWNCKCKNPTIIWLKTDKNTTNEYDIVVEYYLDKISEDDIEANESLKNRTTATEPGEVDLINEDFRRTLNFNNLAFGPPASPVKKESFSLPSFSEGSSSVIFVIALILIIVGLIGIILYKFVFQEKKEKKRPRPVDEEIESLLRRMNR